MRRAQFCAHHASNKQPSTGVVEPEKGVPITPLFGPEKVALAGPAPEAPELVALCGDLTTATNINRALSQVFLLTAQGRISQKQAVAFGYLTQLLLQTVPGIRGEYVSVHGYDAWETNLKSKLTAALSTAAAQTEPPDTTPPSTLPTREGSENQGGAHEQPSNVDLLRRSTNLVQGKYDATPEGRREANALALDLELMKPAPAKPRRDFFSRTVELVRQLRDFRRERSAHESHANQELSRDYKVNQELGGGKEAPAPAAVSLRAPALSAPTASESIFCSSGRGVAVVVDTHGPGAARRNGEKTAPRGSEPALRPLDQSQDSRPAEETPVAKPDVGPTRLHGTGHTTDWYAPPAWSNPRTPDPFPSRREKSRRSLRALAGRRWQD